MHASVSITTFKRPMTVPFQIQKPTVSPITPESSTAQVDGARLTTMVRGLSRREKLSGTPEERESFVLVKSLLDAAGWRTRGFSRTRYCGRYRGDQRACPARPYYTARASAAGAIGQIHIALGRKPHEMCISPV